MSIALYEERTAVKTRAPQTYQISRSSSAFLLPDCSFPPHPLCRHLRVCVVLWTMTMISIKMKRLIFPGTRYPGDQRLKRSTLMKTVSHVWQDTTNKCLVLLTLLHIIEVSKCLAHNL